MAATAESAAAKPEAAIAEAAKVGLQAAAAACLAAAEEAPLEESILRQCTPLPEPQVQRFQWQCSSSVFYDAILSRGVWSTWAHMYVLYTKAP